MGRKGSKEEEELNQAAAIAALVGGLSPQQAIDTAATRFRVLPLDSLAVTDLQTNEDTGLFAKTRPVALGECDAFVSQLARRRRGQAAGA